MEIVLVSLGENFEDTERKISEGENEKRDLSNGEIFQRQFSNGEFFFFNTIIRLILGTW